jgi:hypothetical protein
MTVARRKRQASMQEEMRRLIEGEDLRSQMLLAIQEKLASGDLKTLEFILKQSEEKPPGKELADGVLRVELGPGVEELAQ